MPYEVSVVRCDSYDEPLVRKAVEASLEPLGGMGSVVKKGDRVLIKLNLLSSKPPEAAVTTHPALVKAVVRMVQELGATPIVGDSPGGRSSMTSYKELLENTGISKVIEETGCKSVRFDDDRVEVFTKTAKMFKKLPIARAVTDADVVICLPKLKTHSLAYFTGAVKLLYGYMPGIIKSEYHLHTARDLNLFADLLLDLHEARKPDLNIMDAVIGMEGNGPSSGTPRKIGLILASKSCTAMDYVAVTIAGFKPMKVPTVERAFARGIGPSGMQDITIYGEKVEPLIIKDFIKPAGMPISKVPRFIINGIRRIASPGPRIDAAKCKKCGICVADCPPKAMAIKKGSVPTIDHGKCISCYCCQELCPEGAVYVSTPLVRKFLKK